jgi:ABC-type glycerol-3-phosphate transport system permease component
MHRLHYLAKLIHIPQTLPPVAVTMVLVAMFAWTDFEIKKMQVGSGAMTPYPA